jgi:hypothetical protein
MTAAMSRRGRGQRLAISSSVVHIIRALVSRNDPLGSPLARARLFPRANALAHRHSALLERLSTSGRPRPDPPPIGVRQVEQETQLRIFVLEQEDTLFKRCEVFGASESEGPLHLSCARGRELVIRLTATRLVSVLSW